MDLFSGREADITGIGRLSVARRRVADARADQCANDYLIFSNKLFSPFRFPLKPVPFTIGGRDGLSQRAPSGASKPAAKHRRPLVQLATPT
ncbi:hypothetical protein [Burkholderia sp. Bp8963]|uniref:hypothetical protein n=1 Tax=Burkholderia sp. Bp8963 TaxID=2184547 RepID=UPI000F5A32F8|nr:hypothetical protein [Burkholderia sp. Bp8963]